MATEKCSLKQSSNSFRIDTSSVKHNREDLYLLFTLTATVMRAVAAPMLTNRIIKIIDGRSLSSVASVAVAFLPLSMLNGSTAGAAAAGAGAEVLNQDGDAIFYKYDVSIKEGPEGFCRVPMFLSWCCSLEM